MNDEQDYPHLEYVDQIALDAARDDEHKIGIKIGAGFLIMRMACTKHIRRPRSRYAATKPLKVVRVREGACISHARRRRHRGPLRSPRRVPASLLPSHPLLSGAPALRSPPIPRRARRRSGAGAGARVGWGRSTERWLMRERAREGPYTAHARHTLMREGCAKKAHGVLGLVLRSEVMVQSVQSPGGQSSVKKYERMGQGVDIERAPRTSLEIITRCQRTGLKSRG
ncbi:hypothetical protein C8J57DRAFT_1257574 [Mycena rebaudengoi]|nr:hypothetical protein C8J57DRAFT_1257574 [Mycena rebaudengoi]